MSNASDEQVFNSDISMFMQIPESDVLDDLIEGDEKGVYNEKIL
jgi:hypothetical protein